MSAARNTKRTPAAQRRDRAIRKAEYALANGTITGPLARHVRTLVDHAREIERLGREIGSAAVWGRDASERAALDLELFAVGDVWP